MACKSIICIKKKPAVPGQVNQNVFLCSLFHWFECTEYISNSKQRHSVVWMVPLQILGGAQALSTAFPAIPPASHCPALSGLVSSHFATSSDISNKAVALAQCPQAPTPVNWGFVFVGKKHHFVLSVMFRGRGGRCRPNGIWCSPPPKTEEEEFVNEEHKSFSQAPVWLGGGGLTNQNRHPSSCE